ncbi:sodium/solute symporter [Stieleria varia]|uniref:Cation/acetate symporter ActP n=1 Tax=Stieleria varia TaxID=2528005 RepID=A0A5C6B008_9BACT|nr:cation acetate symporter [Stieleria varia]TWU05107.1 Cation/acetate symporter ActP [Stieleria varia]
MIYEPSVIAVVVFFVFVGATVGLSFFLGRKAKSSEGYFAAHGQIPWAVNGIAFAGDYLSAASFLGICGMIANYGYDGFLYSIGFLAGWIVALFVIAEPMKRLGKFTFADALDSQFDSRGIKAAAGISTLVVSVFYLIPQMVGAGSLIQPLLGFPHWVGVVLVGIVVITIVVTAGMVSTTWVQFLKGSLLVIFSAVLVVLLLMRGFVAEPDRFRELGPMPVADLQNETVGGLKVIQVTDGWESVPQFVRLQRDGQSGYDIYDVVPSNDQETEVVLRQAQAVTKTSDGILINGAPRGVGEREQLLQPVGTISRLPDGESESGPLGPVEFFNTLNDSELILWRNTTVAHADGTKTVVHFQKPTAGSEVLRPGEHPKFAGIRGDALIGKLDFLSLMLALFCGTASLPHILIRYYTVKDGAAARKSTIVGIASIGFFYVLTLFLGLGAMTSGAMDLTDTNMAAPLLARSISTWLFAIISAIAFTTVLGTVSGLILASSGAVAHDLLTGVMGIKMSGEMQVRVAKFAAVVVGVIAIALGILFRELNVGYLVGWAFSVAASANLPALVMLLFWKGTTRQGIIASVLVGMISSLGWILLSAGTYKSVYGLDPSTAMTPFDQPGIVTIPLAFVTLIVVSLLTHSDRVAVNAE